MATNKQQNKKRLGHNFYDRKGGTLIKGILQFKKCDVRDILKRWITLRIIYGTKMVDIQT